MTQKNTSLHNAKSAKKDEFYTQLTDIEKELCHYKSHFRGKTVLCNCDDPYESNFFQYFIINFNTLGLKKLITTCYTHSPIAGKKLYITNDHKISVVGSEAEQAPYKAIVTSARDVTGNGGITQEDYKLLFQTGENKIELLEGDGDFRSPECEALLDEADIVVTNPPFSCWREYVGMLVKHDKKFVIWGNNNALTYKEIFPLIKDNKMWLGYTANKTCAFRLPDTYEKYDKKLTDEHNDGNKYGKVPAISVFTNLDIKKRHEDMILFRSFEHDRELYQYYDNYDAINVDRIADIPYDYCESWELTENEYSQLNPQEWEIVRHGKLGDEPSVLVIPASGTGLRSMLSEHSDGYKQAIENALAQVIIGGGQSDKQDAAASNIHESLSTSRNDLLENNTNPQVNNGVLYDRECNGELGVPLTIMNSFSPDQFEITRFRKGDDNRDLSYTVDSPNGGGNRISVFPDCYPQGVVTGISVSRSRSLGNTHQSSSGLLVSGIRDQQATCSKLENAWHCQTERASPGTDQQLTEKRYILGSLSKRYCNGIIGVPITFVNGYSNDQFRILGLTQRTDDPYKIKKYTKKEYSNCNDLNARAVIITNGKAKSVYARILINKLL